MPAARKRRDVIHHRGAAPFFAHPVVPPATKTSCLFHWRCVRPAHAHFATCLGIRQSLLTALHGACARENARSGSADLPRGAHRPDGQAAPHRAGAEEDGACASHRQERLVGIWLHHLQVIPAGPGPCRPGPGQHRRATHTPGGTCAFYVRLLRVPFSCTCTLSCSCTEYVYRCILVSPVEQRVCRRGIFSG